MEQLHQWGTQLEQEKDQAVKERAFEGILHTIQSPDATDNTKSLGAQLLSKYVCGFPYHETVTMDILLALSQSGEKKQSQAVRIHAILGLVSFVKGQSSISAALQERLTNFVNATLAKETSGVLVRHLTTLHKLLASNTAPPSNPTVVALASSKKEAPSSPIVDDKENKRETIPPSPYLFIKGFPQTTDLEKLIHFFQAVEPSLTRQSIHLHNPHKQHNSHNAFMNCGSVENARNIIEYAASHPFNGRILITLFARGPANNSVVFHLPEAFPTAWSEHPELWRSIETELQCRYPAGSYTIKGEGKASFESLDASKALVAQGLTVNGKKLWVVYDFEEQSKPRPYIPPHLQSSAAPLDPAFAERFLQRSQNSSSTPPHRSGSDTTQAKQIETPKSGGIGARENSNSRGTPADLQAQQSSPRPEANSTDQKPRQDHSSERQNKPSEEKNSAREAAQQSTPARAPTLAEIAREANNNSSFNRRDDRRSRERPSTLGDRRPSNGDISRTNNSDKFEQLDRHKRVNEPRGRQDPDNRIDEPLRGRPREVDQQPDKYQADRSTYRSDRAGRSTSRSRNRIESQDQSKPLSIGEIARGGGTDRYNDRRLQVEPSERRDDNRARNVNRSSERREDNRARNTNRSPERREDNRLKNANRSPERREDNRPRNSNRSPERRSQDRPRNLNRSPERREDNRSRNLNRSPERREDNRPRNFNRSPERRSQERPASASSVPPTRSLGEIARAGGGSLKPRPDRSRSRDRLDQDKSRNRFGNESSNEPRRLPLGRGDFRQRDDDIRERDNRSAIGDKQPPNFRDDDNKFKQDARYRNNGNGRFNTSRDSSMSSRDDRRDNGRGNFGQESQRDKTSSYSSESYTNTKEKDNRSREDGGNFNRSRENPTNYQDSRRRGSETNYRESRHQDSDDDNFRPRDNRRRGSEGSFQESNRSSEYGSGDRNYRSNDSRRRDENLAPPPRKQWEDKGQRREDEGQRPNQRYESNARGDSENRSIPIGELARSAKRRDYGGRDDLDNREGAQRRRHDGDRPPKKDFYEGRPHVDYSGAIFREDKDYDRRPHTPESRSSPKKLDASMERSSPASPKQPIFKSREEESSRRYASPQEINELDVDYEEDDD